MTIVPIAIGVILCVHGLQDLKMSFESYGAGARRVWLSFLLSAFNIILGILCILHSFNFVKLTFIVIGIMLIWDGLTDIGIVHQVKKATKDVVDSTIVSEEDFD